MKTMTKLALLLAMLAAGNSAMAQLQAVLAGKAYNFSSTAEAEGSGTITYQWYRDGEPIAGANGLNYTVPGDLAYGTNVQFRRGAISNDCPGDPVYANTFLITFLEPLNVGGVDWAPFNVAAPNTFASRPDMYTPFYQWNRTTPWPAAGTTVVGWSTTSITDTAWTNNPCPPGWRLPTSNECTALSSSGVTWAAANAKGNAVAGRFFGPNSSTCRLPGNMFNCIFVPSGGYRAYNTGSLTIQGTDGHFWSSTQYSSTEGYYYGFNNSANNPNNNREKATGFNIRCVQ